MSHAYIVEGIRTPIGRDGGALAAVRPDDLAAHAIRALTQRLPSLDWGALDDVVLGCANQAGEDNRNVARMAVLLAGLPEHVPGSTVNRLCGSGADAVAVAARQIRTGEVDLVVAGGVESMSRAPFVLPKAHSAYDRDAEVYDTTIGWRFVNPVLRAGYGIDSMPETAENVAADFAVSREDQDGFALRSQERAAKAIANGRLTRETAPVPVPQRRGDPVIVHGDEHPRPTSLGALARLPTPFRVGGTVTAGNGDVDVVELNEAFAGQSLAVLRRLGLPDDAEHVNPNGGAIALGHPLGPSGARLVLTAALELAERDARRAPATMCIGVGRGISVLIEGR